MSTLKAKFLDYYYGHKKEILFAIIIFLVALTSFNLGYLSSRGDRANIVIEKCSSMSE